MNPTERRRIVWGDGEHANLDPFVVDVFGRVYNGDADRPIKALDRKDAALAWRTHGNGGKLYEIDARDPRLRGRRLPSVKDADLVRGWSDTLRFNPATGEATPVRARETRWLFLLTPSKAEAEDQRDAMNEAWRQSRRLPPVQLLDEPPEWLPLVGNPDDGWVCARLTAAVPFASVFHGPSVAAWLFDDTPST